MKLPRASLGIASSSCHSPCTIKPIRSYSLDGSISKLSRKQRNDRQLYQRSCWLVRSQPWSLRPGRSSHTGRFHLAKLEDFLPKFVVPRELLVVGNRQGINLFRSHLVGRFDFRMCGYAAPQGHGFLSFLSEDPAIP